jgi:protein-tyrosine phosphatase
MVRAWLRRGLGPNPVDFGRVTRLIFVCKGNICRSAYADAAAQERGILVRSCGIHATAGLPADASAQRLAIERGVDLSRHRTACWSDIEVLDSDLVLVMEPWHLGAVRGKVARVQAQADLLGNWAAGRRLVIHDPYGCGDDMFRETFGLIDSAVERLAARLTVVPKAS